MTKNKGDKAAAHIRGIIARAWKGAAINSKIVRVPTYSLPLCEQPDSCPTVLFLRSGEKIVNCSICGNCMACVPTPE